ncbi:MAG: nucleoside phosphorylase [Desulfobaccales bacterium]
MEAEEFPGGGVSEACPRALQGKGAAAALPPVPEAALIQPLRLPHEASVPSRVLLVCTAPDMKFVSSLVHGRDGARRLWLSDLRPGSFQGRELLLAGPVLGGPQAAMVLEKLIALGAREVVALGWCGSLSPKLPAGSLLLPTLAHPGDGTSPHYLAPGVLPGPHPGLASRLRRQLSARAAEPGDLIWQAGPVWSTDAVYRETPALLGKARAAGAVAVEMELAAVLAVAAFRGIAAAGLLVVSDELFGGVWRNLSRSPEVRRARELAARLALACLTGGEEP